MDWSHFERRRIAERGRKRAMMLDNLRGGINYDELKSKAQN